MPDIWQKNGVTSLILREKLYDTTLLFGQGKTGLTFSSAGLIISTIADNEASATTYTQAGSTIETVGALGTFAAPTATKCRFREVDSVNYPGLYEIQIADARWAVSGARYVDVSLPPVSGLGTAPVLKRIQLTADDPQVAKPANFNLLSIDGSGIVAANLVNILGTLLSESIVGNLAAAFKQWFNVTTPTGTVNDSTTLLARLGAFAGSGVNTVLGFLRAMMRSDLTAPSDVGGTYDPAADSLEAIADGTTPSGIAASVWNYLVASAGTDITKMGGYISVFLAAINARVQSGTLVITDGFSANGKTLTVIRYQDYLLGAAGVLQLTVSVPTDPTGSAVYWTFLIANQITQFAGTLISYNSSAGTATFGLPLTHVQTGALPVLDGQFALSAVLPASAGDLQPVPYRSGTLVIVDAPLMPPV